MIYLEQLFGLAPGTAVQVGPTWLDWRWVALGGQLVYCEAKSREWGWARLPDGRRVYAILPECPSPTALPDPNSPESLRLSPRLRRMVDRKRWRMGNG
jgi:hypothetical protein